jgi:DNA-binding transcriptional regulator YiaG
MSQQRFAEAYRIPLKQGRRSPDAPAAASLQAISREPKAIKEALQHG